MLPPGRALLIPWSLFSRHNAESPTSFCRPRLDMLLFSHVFLFRTGHNPPWMQRDTALPHVDNACQGLHLGPSARYSETSDWNWLSSAPFTSSYFSSWISSCYIWPIVLTCQDNFGNSIYYSKYHHTHPVLGYLWFWSIAFNLWIQPLGMTCQLRGQVLG